MTVVADGRDDQLVAVWMSASCRPLRRSLRPLAWAVLEEVAFDAAVEHGRVVARTSARQIAEHLGIDPGTAASALRTLRERGLLHTFREQGPAGRFGLAVYELHPIDGLGVAQPSVESPYTARPSAVQPREAAPTPVTPTTAAPNMVPPKPECSDRAVPGCQSTSCRQGGAGLPTRDAASGDYRGRQSASTTASASRSAQCPGQTAFDLGPVSS